LCGTDNGSCYVWKQNSNEPLIVQRCYDVAIQSLLVHEEFFITCTSETISRWSFRPKEEQEVFLEKDIKYHSDHSIRSLYTVDNNSIIGVIYENNLLIIWNLNTNELTKNKPLGKESSNSGCVKKLNSGKYMHIIVLENMTVSGIIY